MPLSARDWLNVKFVEKVLKKTQCDQSIKVKDLTTNPVVGTGDNYGSVMIRSRVNYLRNESGCEVAKTMSLIFKLAPLIDAAGRDQLKVKFETFDIEIDMMQTTLAKMNGILNEKNCRLGPRFLYAEIRDRSIIVMEDLTPLGYRMGDRLIGLDLQHCLLVMRNLAKFHASSVALNEKETLLQKIYNKGTFVVNCPPFWKMFCRNGMWNLAQETLNWPELGSNQRSYSEKLIKLSEVCYESVLKCLNQKTNTFKVLNHGDCWINNMLFRYDDGGKLADHIFVDFQLSVWNSPAIDIHNFFSTSLAETVELHHRQTLLEEYLNTLTETMANICCKTKAPTMEDLEKSLKDYEFYGVMSSCLFLPMVLLDKSETITFKEAVQSDDYINPIYKGKMFRKRILRRLFDWNARGLIDI